MESFWKLVLLEGWISVIMLFTSWVLIISLLISEGQRRKKLSKTSSEKPYLREGTMIFATKRFPLCGFITNHSSQWCQYFKSMWNRPVHFHFDSDMLSPFAILRFVFNMPMEKNNMPVKILMRLNILMLLQQWWEVYFGFRRTILY